MLSYGCVASAYKVLLSNQEILQAENNTTKHVESCKIYPASYIFRATHSIFSINSDHIRKENHVVMVLRIVIVQSVVMAFIF
jgi:hypothetical protein